MEKETIFWHRDVLAIVQKYTNRSYAPEVQREADLMTAVKKYNSELIADVEPHDHPESERPSEGFLHGDKISLCDIIEFVKTKHYLWKFKPTKTKLSTWNNCHKWFNTVKLALGQATTYPLMHVNDFWNLQPVTIDDTSMILHYCNADVRFFGQKAPRLSDYNMKHLLYMKTVLPSKISVQLQQVSGLFLVGVCLYSMGKTNRKFYYSNPQLIADREDITFEVNLSDKNWRYDMKALLFKGEELPQFEDSEYQMGIYCILKEEPQQEGKDYDSSTESIGSSDEEEYKPSVQISASVVLYQKAYMSDQLLREYKIPTLCRLVPEVSKYKGMPFVGHTLNGETIWKKENGDHLLKLAISPDDKIICTDNSYLDVSLGQKIYRFDVQTHRWSDDEEKNSLISAAFSRLMAYLHEASIRSIPLMKVFWHLAERNECSYPLAIVGGAVRDILNPKGKPDDVDIVVGGHYTQLETHLRDFFVEQKESVSKNTLFTKTKSKQYGQLKIMKILNETQPLDVALFKAHKVNPEQQLFYEDEEKSDENKEKHQDGKKKSYKDLDSLYVFGFSYGLDASHRDYTINALYFQLFPFPAFIDPTGNGLADFNSNTLRLACEQEFGADLGGQLRFWKMKYKNEYKDIDKTSLDEMSSKVNQLLLAYIQSIKSTDDYIKFLQKLRSKLFKVGGALEKFIEDITKDEYFTRHNDQCWWNVFLGKLKEFKYPRSTQLEEPLMILIEKIRRLDA